MPFVTKKMNIKNAWVFVKPSGLKRYPYFTPMGTLLCRLHLWAQSSINQAKHEIMLTCVIAFVRPLLGSSTAVKESPAMLRLVPYRTKNLGSEQYPQNGNLLICSTLEVGELTSQYISRLRIVTKIKKIPGKSLTLGDSNVFCTFTNLNQGGKSDFSANQDFWSRWSLTCIYHLPLNLADDKLVAVGGFQTFQG